MLGGAIGESIALGGGDARAEDGPLAGIGNKASEAVSVEDLTGEDGVDRLVGVDPTERE